MIVPLFPGVPGGPELLVIMVVFLVVVVGPGILLVLLGVRFLGDNDDKKRIQELEARIDELEAERGVDSDETTDGGVDGRRTNDGGVDNQRG
jgi:sec-independent protein translocase protein TatA